MEKRTPETLLQYRKNISVRCLSYSKKKGDFWQRAAQFYLDLKAVPLENLPEKERQRVQIIRRKMEILEKKKKRALTNTSS